MSDKASWAWAAGFIEGEGNFYLRRKKNGYAQIIIQVWQCNREPLDRLIKVFGFGKVLGPYKNNSGFKRDCVLKEKYGVFICQAVQVRQVYEHIEPWLSAEKREQAQRALIAYDAYKSEIKL